MDEILWQPELLNIEIQLNELRFLVNLTVGLAKCNSYYVVFEFLDLSAEVYNSYVDGMRAEPPVIFECDELRNQGFDITQIVIEEAYHLKNGNVVWQGLSGGEYKV